MRTSDNVIYKCTDVETGGHDLAIYRKYMKIKYRQWRKQYHQTISYNLSSLNFKKTTIYHVIIPGPVFGQEQKGGGIPVKTVYTEEVPIYTSQSITQRK